MGYTHMQHAHDLFSEFCSLEKVYIEAVHMCNWLIIKEDIQSIYIMLFKVPDIWYLEILETCTKFLNMV